MISVLYAEGDHDFPLKNFCLAVPKHFVKEPFCVSESFGYRKILCLRGLCHDFLSKIFCLKVPKNFVGEPFCAVFQKISRSEKVFGLEGGEYQDFPSKFFCLTVPKNFVIKEPFSVSLISGIEKC